MPSLTWNEGGGLSVREQYAINHLYGEIERLASGDQQLKELLPSVDGKLLLDLPAARPLVGHGGQPAGTGDSPNKVAIVGAGVTGLFLGMMLDYFNKNVPAFDVEYDILEAAPEERVGGRLFTYNFPPKLDSPPGPHDYYDVGGMRFPQNPVMTRAFDLFTFLGMPFVNKDEMRSDTPNGSLIPYSMQNSNAKGQNEPFCFNGVTKWGSYLDIAASAGEGGDAFGFNQDPYAPEIPSAVLKMKPGDVVDEAMHTLRDAIKDDGKKGWKKLMDYDKYTTRDWLGSNWDHHGFLNPKLPPFNATTINFLETMNGGTDWYDQALSETVLESLDFNYSDPGGVDYPWWCIMGGAQQLPILMEKQLARKPTYSTTVKAISAISDPDSDWQMEVTTTSSSTPQQYNGVFNTTTLGCLRRIDTTGCTISNSAKMAHRALAYGQSCKVGIKFSHAWWLHSLPPSHRITTGGLGHSDLHIRTVVYPSYNILDPADQPAVLLVSYTWQQDAERVGALISSDSPNNEGELKTLLLRELAKLHSTSPEEETALFTNLSNPPKDGGWYLDHYAHDWSHDPNTAGAFAFFRAQQFSTLWPKIVLPSGNLVIAGEAASPHHAWVVGALESAVVGLYSWLYSRSGEVPGAAEVMALIDGEDGPGEDGEERKGVPFLGLPGYMPTEHARALGLVSAVRGQQDAMRA